MTSKAFSCSIILLFFEMSYQAKIQTPELLKDLGKRFGFQPNCEAQQEGGPGKNQGPSKGKKQSQV